jgi:hypothetical protein
LSLCAFDLLSLDALILLSSVFAYGFCCPLYCCCA